MAKERLMMRVCGGAFSKPSVVIAAARRLKAMRVKRSLGRGLFQLAASALVLAAAESQPIGARRVFGCGLGATFADFSEVRHLAHVARLFLAERVDGDDLGGFACLCGLGGLAAFASRRASRFWRCD